MKLINVLFILIILVGCSSVSREDFVKRTSFYTKAALLDGLECLNKDHYNLELSCHRLKKGKNFVVAVRDYSANDNHHSERFKKFTLFLPENIKLGERYVIDAEAEAEVEAFLGYGFTYGPGKVGCFGRAHSGMVEVIKLTLDRVVVRVKINFHMKSPLGWKNRCGLEEYSETIAANYKEYEALDAWDGVRKNNSRVIDEAHPNFN